MSKLREKIFINVVSNLLIFLVVAGVFALSFSNTIITVLSSSEFEPYYHGDEDKQQVSLMINVYWGTEYIDEMLQILDEYETKATFFIGGSWAEKNAEMLLKIHEKGHELGNHGFYHKDHENLSLERNSQEIVACQNIVESITGVTTNLFAPPSGSFSKTTLEVAGGLGYSTVMWSKDTIDWRDKDKQLAYTRATKDLCNGDLILMHPTEHTKNALSDILKYYKDNNFTQVIVSRNLGLN